MHGLNPTPGKKPGLQSWQLLRSMFLFYLLSAALSFGQESAGALRLIHADSLRSFVANGESIIEAIGNVEIEQDSTTLTCDLVRMIEARSRYVFLGNVHIREGSKWLRADSVVHYDDRKIQVAVGRVVLGDAANQLTARKVTYFQNQDRALAEEEVVMINSDRRLTLTCGKAEYLSEEEYAKATIAPVLIEYDSLQQETLRITGEVIELIAGGREAKVTGNVEITREQTRAHCEETHYYHAEERLDLLTNPVVWQGRDELRGETIELFLKEQKLVRAHVAGKAVMTSPVDTSAVDTSQTSRRLNSLSGGKMTLSFHDEQLEQVLVEETATSVYYVIEDGEDKGTNRVQGDRIMLHLANKELERIVIESDPGVSNGKFLPPGHPVESP